MFIEYIVKDTKNVGFYNACATDIYQNIHSCQTVCILFKQNTKYEK